MNKSIILIPLAATLLASCAKSAVSTTGEDAQRALEAWVSINGEGWEKTTLGNYIISSTPGSGIAVGSDEDHPYVRLKYTIKDLEGNVTSTTDAATARRWGTYSNKFYYGPEVFVRESNSMYAGIDEIIETMNVGGKCSFLLPGWLLTTSRYSTPAKYVANYDGVSENSIYEIEVVDAIEDIDVWEKNILKEYVEAHYPEATSDTAGFYKVVLREPTAAFTVDTTIYINYTGRLLSGEIFDTTIRDTANFYWRENFDNTATFSHALINWNKSDETEITMTSSETSIITGFSHLLHSMGAYEKSIGIFYSGWGYTSTGSTDSDSGSTTIPSYAPLIFEVEIVDK